MSGISLQSDDFSLFGVPRRFSLDVMALEARWRDLQREAHPDRFAAEGSAAQRLATQWSVRINEAYRRLRDPLRRAAYLCELSGARVDAEGSANMPTAFLQQQMAWREALDDAGDDAAAIQSLADEVSRSRGGRLASLAELLDGPSDGPDGEPVAISAAQAAAAQVRAMMFLDRFSQDLNRRQDALNP